MIDLEDWGLDPFFRRAAQEGSDPDNAQPLARVVRSFGMAVDAVTNDGDITLRVPLSLGSGDLVVGDWVLFDPVEAMVRRVLPRRSALKRKRPGNRSETQVLCANVDVALVLTGLDDDFSLRRIERYLALVGAGNVDAVLLLSKADVGEEVERRREEVEAIADGRPVIATAAPVGEGVAAVQEVIAGKTAVLLGSSGVGKSTLLNALLGEQRAATGSIMGDGRGRHTTTHRELFLLPFGGVLADVPGIREVGLVDADVDEAFGDIVELTRLCRFRNCQHSGEPGCAVEEALEKGNLDPVRFDSYRTLQAEAGAATLRHDEHARRKAEKAHPAVRLRLAKRKRKR